MSNLIPIGEVAEVFNGKTPSKAEKRVTGFPILKIKDVDEKSRFKGNFESFVDQDFRDRYANKVIKQNDTLILNAAHNADYVGSKQFKVPSEIDGVLATGEWLVVRPNSKVADQSYVNHWLKCGDARFQIRNLVKGIHLYPKDVARLKFPLPPLAEQKRIAAILDRADAIRRKREEAIKLTDTLLKSVFLDMFGDPVTNPKGWEVCKLGDLVEWAKDGPHVSPKYSDESGIPFLSTRHVKPSGVIWEDLKHISHEEAQVHWKKCKPSVGDVLYTKGGTTGIACPVNFEADFAVWVHVALLRPKPSIANFVWLAAMLNTPHCYRQSQKFTRGATNKDLGLTRMVNIEMFLPPLSKQLVYENFVQKLNRQLNRLLNQSEALGTLTASLTQRAFKGELTASDLTKIEAEIEAAE